MPDLLAPYHAGVAVAFAYRQTMGAVNDKNSRKTFLEGLLPLFERQCQQGRLQPTQDGWTMTDQGARAVLTIYEDINRTLAYFQVPAAKYIQMCLTSKLEISRSVSRGVGCRKRIGELWEPQLRDALLKSEETNPFIKTKTLKSFHEGRFSAGVLYKVMSSQRCDLFLVRVLGLAQLCGIRQVTIEDLPELTVNSHMYEKLARAHITAIIGAADTSFMTNMAFGNIFNGQPLGSTQHIDSDFQNKALQMHGELVQIGTVDPSTKSRLFKSFGDGGSDQWPSGGVLNMTFPRPLEQLNMISINTKSDIKAQMNEPVFMQKGWAIALGTRPLGGRAMQQRQDVHGNQLYLNNTLPMIQIRVKRVADGRLMAKATGISVMKLPKTTGQGVYGIPCGCTAPDPARVVRSAGGPRTINGIRILEHSNYNLSGEIQFNDLYVDWYTGDLAGQLFRVELLAHSTYIQVKGECFYCAADRALGVGCAFLVAGGL